MADSYWDGGRRRRQRNGAWGAAGSWLAWVERVVVLIAVVVWGYGMWVAITDDMQRGTALAVPAGIVLMLAAWRRGVFEAPWFP